MTPAPSTAARRGTKAEGGAIRISVGSGDFSIAAPRPRTGALRAARERLEDVPVLHAQYVDVGFIRASQRTAARRERGRKRRRPALIHFRIFHEEVREADIDR